MVDTIFSAWSQQLPNRVGSVTSGPLSQTTSLLKTHASPLLPSEFQNVAFLNYFIYLPNVMTQSCL